MDVNFHDGTPPKTWEQERADKWLEWCEVVVADPAGRWARIPDTFLLKRYSRGLYSFALAEGIRRPDRIEVQTFKDGMYARRELF